MNKKGNIMGIILFIGLLFIILFLGFIMATGNAVLNWVFDVTVPELNNLGTVGLTNLTEIADLTINPLNNIVQQFTWLTGVLYVMMLIGSVGFAFMIRTSPSRWLVGFYFMLMIMLVLGSMFISNMYEEFYNGTDDLATRLQEHTILSYMILYSPMIFTIIGFLTGIILFSGMQEDGFV